MKRISLFAIVMCVVMLFSATAVFAADVTTEADELNDTKAITSGTVSLVRESKLCGKMSLTCSSSSTDVAYIKAIVTVERKYSSGWDQYYTPYEIFGNDYTGNLGVVEYIDVKASGTYRVKVVFEDKKGSVITRTDAKYSQAVSL